MTIKIYINQSTFERGSNRPLELTLIVIMIMFVMMKVITRNENESA